MDDWSALELEGDDEELENLFGNKSSLQRSKVSTALHARPSPQTSQSSVLQPSHNTTFCANPTSVPAATSAIARPPVSTQANSRRRVAASFGPSPDRVAGQSLLDDLTDTAYDELELDSCSALTNANTTTRSRGTYGSQNTVVRHDLPQHSAKAHGINIPSQTTEQWLGLPEPSQHRSQPNVQRPAPAPAVSNSTRTNAVHLRALHADVSIIPLHETRWFDCKLALCIAHVHVQPHPSMGVCISLGFISYGTCINYWLLYRSHLLSCYFECHLGM